MKTLALKSTVSGNYLITENGKIKTSNESEFENIKDFIDSLKTFESKEEAKEYIKENDFFALEIVEVDLQTL
jgi:hypothetical protein